MKKIHLLAVILPLTLLLSLAIGSLISADAAQIPTAKATTSVTSTPSVKVTNTLTVTPTNTATNTPTITPTLKPSNTPAKSSPTTMPPTKVRTPTKPPSYP